MEELKPVTRKEKFLAKAAGQDVETPEPITREEMYLKKIAEGGSSLPSVTSADNGKVLAVVNDEWAADSNLFVVRKSESGNYADKTSDEIEAAADSGKTVIFIGSQGETYAYVGRDGVYIYFITSTSSWLETRLIKKSNGSIYSSSYAKVPTVTASDNGSELIVKSGVWQKQKKKFIVTLTPTSPDYSGTMDKTVAEINAAYEAGQEIVFKLQTGASTYIEVPVQLVGHDTTATYPSFEASAVQRANNVQVFAYTGTNDDGTKQTYSTVVYALTPAS